MCSPSGKGCTARRAGGRHLPWRASLSLNVRTLARARLGLWDLLPAQEGSRSSKKHTRCPAPWSVTAAGEAARTLACHQLGL